MKAKLLDKAIPITAIISLMIGMTAILGVIVFRSDTFDTIAVLTTFAAVVVFMIMVIVAIATDRE